MKSVEGPTFLLKISSIYLNELIAILTGPHSRNLTATLCHVTRKLRVYRKVYSPLCEVVKLLQKGANLIAIAFDARLPPTEEFFSLNLCKPFQTLSL